MILFYILLSAFLIAINFYGVMLMNFQRKAMEEGDDGKTVSDGKIFTVALLGGTLGIYLYMILKKYRLKSIGFVVLLPLIFILNVYLIYFAAANNFGVF